MTTLRVEAGRVLPGIPGASGGTCPAGTGVLRRREDREGQKGCGGDPGLGSDWTRDSEDATHLPPHGLEAGLPLKMALLFQQQVDGA